MRDNDTELLLFEAPALGGGLLSSKRYPRWGATGSWKPRLRKPSDSPKFTELVRNRAKILITIRLNPKSASFHNNRHINNSNDS